MQWGQIKTLSILCFLILDIYLLVLFLEKQNAADIGILENQDSTIEDQLKAEDIKYEDLPKGQPDEAFISVKQKTFTEEELNRLAKFDNLEFVDVNNNFIISQFEEPIPIPNYASKADITTMVRANIIFPETYNYWGWNEELNVLIFFQEKNERPIYFNQNGTILVYLNDKSEMVAYTQTMLGETETSNDKKSLIKPIEAVGKLYTNNQLYFGAEVTDMEIGYHTMVPLANGVQVFVPTWKVTIGENRDYFVNAIEGLVFSGNDRQFLNDIITTSIDKLRQVEGHKKLKENMLQLLNEKQEAFIME